MRAGVVGALGQLTYWFDQFRNSPTFAAFDVPLLGPVLDNALQVADAFRDKVLIDDNDNGLDDSKTLLFDLNAALAEAGLEDKLFAANLGGKLTLIALDSAFPSFTVAGAQPLASARCRRAACRRDSSSTRHRRQPPSSTSSRDGSTTPGSCRRTSRSPWRPPAAPTTSR